MERRHLCSHYIDLSSGLAGGKLALLTCCELWRACCDREPGQAGLLECYVGMEAKASHLIPSWPQVPSLISILLASQRQEEANGSPIVYIYIIALSLLASATFYLGTKLGTLFSSPSNEHLSKKYSELYEEIAEKY